jgi:hypothetical protein
MFNWIVNITQKVKNIFTTKKPTPILLYQEEILKDPKIGDHAKVILRLMFEQPTKWSIVDEYYLVYNKTDLKIWIASGKTFVKVTTKYKGKPFAFDFTEYEHSIIWDEYQKYYFINATGAIDTIKKYI